MTLPAVDSRDLALRDLADEASALRERLVNIEADLLTTRETLHAALDVTADLTAQLGRATRVTEALRAELRRYTAAAVVADPVVA